MARMASFESALEAANADSKVVEESQKDLDQRLGSLEEGGGGPGAARGRAPEGGGSRFVVFFLGTGTGFPVPAAGRERSVSF